ncbi:MAG: hypothetical protein JSV03_10095, partial [Planctomycetota bacterium]
MAETPSAYAPSTVAKGETAFLTDVFSFDDGQRSRIELNGLWEFRRDPDNQGRIRGWHEGREQFPQKIRIPGVPQAQGIGEPNMRQKTFFMEPFWVRRHFDLPALEPNQRIWLRSGGILPAGEIYLNGRCVGYTKSSRTQQRADVTRFVKPAT